MIKLSSVLAVAFILLLCSLPLASTSMQLDVKATVEIAICLVAVTILLLALYRIINLNLRHKIEEETRQKQAQVSVKEIPDDILKSLSIYNGIAVRNYWFYRALGIISLATSLFITVALGADAGISTYAIKLIAYISSLSTSIVFTFNLVEKSNRARKAFRHLLDGVMLYRYSDFPIIELLEKYKESETYLGDDEFNQNNGNTSKQSPS